MKSNTKRMTRRRLHAFTLLELACGLAIAGIVLTALTGLYLQLMTFRTHARALDELMRDGAFATALLEQDLRGAGLGVPTDAHISSDYGTATTTFPSVVLLANTSEFGIVGDLPSPDANFPTFGFLHDRAAGDGAHVAFHSESNGSCVPDTSAATCNIVDASVFFPGDSKGNCRSTASDRTCAWGLRRVVAGERIQVVAGDGMWTHTAAASPLAVSATAGSKTTKVFALNLSGAWDTDAWPNAVDTDLPTASSGQGYVTSLDRVFYRTVTSTKTLERQQCWGDPDPSNPNWPPAAATTMPTTFTYTPNAPARGIAPVTTSCTDWEVVAGNVASVTFKYFNANNVQLTSTPLSADDKSTVRRVEFRIVLQQAVRGTNVEYDAAGSARLVNVN
jgi:prepilin-type N-terminal cleavage/methylation domain-containing protein